MRRYTDLVRHGGNRALFKAAEMSVLSTRKGWPFHLHAEGVRGTGKTSILRSMQDVLPRIKRVQGCQYNCTPQAPHCPQHRDLTPTQIKALGTEWVPMPFLEISHSAKLGTVVGTIDLNRITETETPAAVLLPGTLARAHRGIVFVDEINRLADTAPELADVLLDVMGTRPGRLQIEESGLPVVQLPLRATVWAASNPDEEPGPLEEIRRQLADRFDFTVPVGRPNTPHQVRLILDALDKWMMGARLQAEEGPANSGVGTTVPAAAVAAQPQGGSARRQRLSLLVRSGRHLPQLDDNMRELLATLYIRYELESLRAVEAWQWASRLAALQRGSQRVNRDDLLAVASMILGHRMEARELAELLAELDQPADMELAAGGDESPPFQPGEPGTKGNQGSGNEPLGGGPGENARRQGQGAQGHEAQRSGAQGGRGWSTGGGGAGGGQTSSSRQAAAHGTPQTGSQGRAGPPGGQDQQGKPAGSGWQGSLVSQGKHSLVERLRSWLGNEEEDGPSSSAGGLRHAPGRVPAPPHTAIPLHQLAPQQVYRRLHTRPPGGNQ